MTGNRRHSGPLKGRGATLSPAARYLAERRESSCGPCPAASGPVETTLTAERCRSIISYNQSPDVGFDRSINPYRGCEHGCVYCFARPTHAWLDLSPGLDFETRLFYKEDAPDRLREALGRPGYRCAPLALGINTDAYQPVERRLGLTRRLLEILVACGHPFSIVTKSALIERDLDLLSAAAGRGQAAVAISLSTLDTDLARRLEPRAAAPRRRLETVRRLAEAGIPVSVLVAPLIPALCDHELERILEAAREAGARHADYVLLRLPHELKEMFRDWLKHHFPDRAGRVMNRIRDMRGGQDYDARFGLRMRGSGVFADLIARRFRIACRRLDYGPAPALDCSAFVPPGRQQLNLF
ncbi:MAG TPA: PA0069 family radical SAM protein [Gammaproteobacteria bacterium]|nr:PA0069 family radical SAM protein [Gammaproteobacteria bacterium]